MNDIITVLDLIKQMSVLVPSIIAGTMVLTGLINGAFNIQNNNAKHIISWVIAVVGALVTCATGGMVFGFGAWDYALAATVGLVAGGASNGVYDWPAVSNIIDKFYDLFGHGNKDK
jgi:Na+/citrate or Na+/malate symporter